MKALIILIFSAFLALNVFAQTRPPEVPADNEFYKMGFLDVTLFGADKTGITVSTTQIQNAVTAAQKYKLACYFPSGTYLIDNTVHCVMPIYQNSSGLDITDRRMPVYIVGAENPRPVIKLASGAAGFGAGTLKSMFWLRASETSPTSEQSNIAFNLMVRNLVFDLNGNRGAIGLRFAGAQGSAIEDVKVIATGAFAGFYNSPGQGGGCYNIEVEGGDHAWYLADDNSRFLNMTGITCKNQVLEVFKIVTISRPMQVTGFHIVKQSGAIFAGWPPSGSGLSLVDGIVEYTGTYPSANLLPTPSNNLYMEDVFVKNCSAIIPSNAASALDPLKWSRIVDYRYTGPGGSSLINGIMESANTSKLNLKLEETPLAAEMIAKHTWNPITFPFISQRNESTFVNVMDAAKMTGPAGVALGNGSKIDTKALQWAINNYEKVFLPKGTYLIDTTLVLKSKTQFFGCGKTYTVIQPAKTWKTTTNRTMISTVADVNATTSLSFILLETDPTVYQDMSRVDWQAGPNSIIRDLMIGAVYSTKTGNMKHHLLKLSGPTAGGRFFSFSAENNTIKLITENPEYRAVRIENTEQPIRFYSYNSERIDADYQFEIKNSKNVEIYYFKSESNGGDGQAAPLYINNSENIRLYCMAGNLKLRAGNALVESNNSNNVLVSCLKSSHILDTNFNVKEIYGSATNSIAPMLNACVFSRNAITTHIDQVFKSSNSNVKMIPNPVRDVLYINTGGKLVQKIAIYSLAGSKILEKNIASANTSFNLEKLNPGIFFVSIAFQDGTLQNSTLVKE